MTEISALATLILNLLQDFLRIISTKSFVKYNDLTVAKIWYLVEDEFSKDASTKEVLNDLIKKPEDDNLRVAFHMKLEKLLVEDSSFASELARSIQEYKGQIIGDGAIAQGDNAKAVGTGGVIIGGDLNSNVEVGSANRLAGDQSTDAPLPDIKKVKKNK